MNCTIRIKNNNVENLFTLAPYRAVVEQMGEYFVFVVGDSSKVTQRKITLGSQINDKVIVNSGLDAGETIVVDGVQKLKDGAVVQAGAVVAKGK
jgi:membrane fusion protein (multidrug efflux system)